MSKQDDPPPSYDGHGVYPTHATPYPPQGSEYPLQTGDTYSAPPQYPPPGSAYESPDKNYASDIAVEVQDSTNDDVDLIRRGGLSDPDIRRAFIRKVYLILCTQFAITVATVFLMQKFIGNQVESIDYILLKKIYITMWVCFVVFFTVEIVLVCCKSLRRKHPVNIILLAVFTISMSGFVGCVTLYYSITALVIAMGSTVIIVLGLTIFACQTKVDFSSKGTYIYAVFLVIICFGFFMIFYYSRVMHVIYGCIGVLIFSLFLVYDTQLLIGGRKYQLTEEEYVFGALTIYIDVIQIFLSSLRVIGRR